MLLPKVVVQVLSGSWNRKTVLCPNKSGSHVGFSHSMRGFSSGQFLTFLITLTLIHVIKFLNMCLKLSTSSSHTARYLNERTLYIILSPKTAIINSVKFLPSAKQHIFHFRCVGCKFISKKPLSYTSKLNGKCKHYLWIWCIIDINSSNSRIQTVLTRVQIFR